MLTTDLLLSVVGALVVALWFFIRKWMDEIKKAIEKYSEQQRVCQLSLATTYRTRGEAEKAWEQHAVEDAERDRTVDDIKTRIVRLEEKIQARGH